MTAEEIAALKLEVGKEIARGLGLDFTNGMYGEAFKVPARVKTKADIELNDYFCRERAKEAARRVLAATGYRAPILDYVDNSAGVAAWRAKQAEIDRVVNEVMERENARES